LARAEIVAVTAFAVGRLAMLLAWGGARRSGDSVTYLPGSLPTLDFLGNALKLWTVPLLFHIAPTDGTRMLAQHLIATGAWLLLAFAVRSRLQHPTARVGGFIAILVLGLSQQVIGWDSLMLSESLGLSLTVIVAGLWLLRRRLSLTGDVLLGLATVLLLFARNSMIVLPLLVGCTAAVSAIRSFRAEGRAAARNHLVLLSIVVVGFGWLAVALPRQNESYRQRDGLGISYGGELAATLLWDRLLADPASTRWLEARGMPAPRGGIRPPPDGVDSLQRAVSWLPFLATAASDVEWRRWLDDQGSSLPVVWAIERPVSAARTLRHLVPVTLASRWEGGIIGYGPPTVRGVPASVQPFFRGRGLMSDLTVLVVGAAGAWAVARGRRAQIDRAAMADALLLMAVAASAVAIGVLFSGLEYTRHALPGPQLLRAALVMLVCVPLDALLAPREKEQQVDDEHLDGQQAS
jgi:hypothetical protein